MIVREHVALSQTHVPTERPPLARLPSQNASPSHSQVQGSLATTSAHAAFVEGRLLRAETGRAKADARCEKISAALEVCKRELKTRRAAAEGMSSEQEALVARLRDMESGFGSLLTPQPPRAASHIASDSPRGAALLAGNDAIPARKNGKATDRARAAQAGALLVTEGMAAEKPLPPLAMAVAAAKSSVGADKAMHHRSSGLPQLNMAAKVAKEREAPGDGAAKASGAGAGVHGHPSAAVAVGPRRMPPPGASTDRKGLGGSVGVRRRLGAGKRAAAEEGNVADDNTASALHVKAASLLDELQQADAINPTRASLR